MAGAAPYGATTSHPCQGEREGECMNVLAVSASSDEVLALAAPFAVAAHRDTAIVVDLDREGLAFPGTRTLGDLVSEQPTLDDLVPRRRGLVSLPNGGIDLEDALPILDALGKGWPAVVIRSREPVPGVPHAPVVPALAGADPVTAIWVRTGLADPAGEGPVVRGPTRDGLRRIVEGRTPSGRWVRSWAAAWSWPWR